MTRVPAPQASPQPHFLACGLLVVVVAWGPLGTRDPDGRVKGLGLEYGLEFDA